ncbi:hypothetical protein ABFX02_08G147601 [Erythranthe guttata]
MRDNRAEDWIRDRIGKYGAVSKMNVFGTPSVLICGPEANKFVYTCDERVLSNKKPASVRKMLGERNILELSGEDHKRVRGAMLLFLKPDVLKQSVAKMDEEIRIHLEEYWHGGDNHQVMPLMKTLTFDVISTLIFGIERGSRRRRLVRLFQQVMNGMSALPINLPFTLFNKGVRARSEVRDIVMELIREKRQEMEKRKTLDNYKFVSMKNEEDSTSSSPMLSDDEIVDNCIVAMVAGHDTSSVLLTFLVKLLSEKIIKLFQDF